MIKQEIFERAVRVLEMPGAGWDVDNPDVLPHAFEVDFKFCLITVLVTAIKMDPPLPMVFAWELLAPFEPMLEDLNTSELREARMIEFARKNCPTKQQAIDWLRVSAAVGDSDFGYENEE